MDWNNIMLLLAVSMLFGNSFEKTGIQAVKEDILKRIQKEVDKKDISSQELGDYTQILSLLKTI